MSITLKPTKVWPDSSGIQHADRATALQAQKTIERTKKLHAIMADAKLVGVGSVDDSNGAYLEVNDIPEFIAANADLILGALSVREARAPRVAKAG